MLELKWSGNLRRLNVGWNDLDDSSLGDGWKHQLQHMFKQAGSSCSILDQPDFSGGDVECHYSDCEPDASSANSSCCVLC